MTLPPSHVRAAAFKAGKDLCEGGHERRRSRSVMVPARVGAFSEAADVRKPAKAPFFRIFQKEIDNFPCALYNQFTIETIIRLE